MQRPIGPRAITFLLVLVLSCRARFVRAVEGADAQKPSRRAALNAAIASLRSHHGQQDPSSGVSAASRTPPVFIPSFLPQLRASEQRNPAKHPYPHRVTLPPLHNTRSPSPPRLSLSRFPKQPRRSGLRLPRLQWRCPTWRPCCVSLRLPAALFVVLQSLDRSLWCLGFG